MKKRSDINMYDFKEKREEIIRLKSKLKELSKSMDDTRNELETLEKQVYNDYFNLEREEYALLTDIPDKPSSKTKNVLYDYSNLNIDEVGKMICELFDRYEHKNMAYKRESIFGYAKGDRGYYHTFIPALIIGEDVENNITNLDNIVIEYSKNSLVKDYLTKSPNIWNEEFKTFNYNYLIGEYVPLSFDYQNHEFIKELIYSLAYYQKQHDITYMDEEETRRVYKRIYKK